jgi:hypothetical protein
MWMLVCSWIWVRSAMTHCEGVVEDGNGNWMV